MTLRELAGAYGGSITIKVYAAAEDGTPIVAFPSDNYEAIKEEILDKTVDHYSTKVIILYAELVVVLAAEETPDVPEEPGEVTEETP